MRNAVVMGAGRSGTSLLAGLFHSSGYFSGDNLWPGTVSNPLGYFEDAEINNINEDLLNKVAPWRPRGMLGTVLPVRRERPKWGQRWLSALPAGIQIPSDPVLDTRMTAVAGRRPYLFKDPRFSYTLPAWLPHLADGTVLLCVFREPGRTVDSIMKVIRNERYLSDLRLSPEAACRYWEAIYSSVLAMKERVGGDWVFVHYDELLSGRAVAPLESRLGARADREMIHADLNRSGKDAEAQAHAALTPLYQAMLELAEQKYAG